MRPKRLLLWMSLLVALGAGGCGDDDPEPASQPQPKAPATAGAALGDLEGAWAVEFGRDAPRELRQEGFTVQFLPEGGVDGAAAMGVKFADGGLYTTALPVVDGQTLTLRDQPCDDSSRGAASIDQSYTFEVSGDDLIVEAVEGGERCDDGYVEALLTTKPLRRAAA